MSGAAPTPDALRRSHEGPGTIRSDGPSGDGVIDAALQEVRAGVRAFDETGRQDAQPVLDAASSLDAALQTRLREAEA